MKKIMMSVALIAAMGLNAAAWFDGGLGMTKGPDGYSRTDAYITIGGESIWVKPALMRQDSDNIDKAFNTYSVRVGKDASNYTVAGEVGMTPATEYTSNVEYSNMTIGGDITVSLTPSAGGKGRLAGPNARPASGGGEGITRVDVGAGLKRTTHKVEMTASDLDAAQTAFSVFAGAKILMLNLGATWTGYSYDDKSSPIFNVAQIPGLATAIIGVAPKSSVNVRLDIPATIPMVSPYASYTTTKFNGANVDDLNAYGFGAYIDLNMVGANVMWQVLDDGDESNSYLLVNAGLKF